MKPLAILLVIIGSMLSCLLQNTFPNTRGCTLFRHLDQHASSRHHRGAEAQRVTPRLEILCLPQTISAYLIRPSTSFQILWYEYAAFQSLLFQPCDPSLVLVTNTLQSRYIAVPLPPSDLSWRCLSACRCCSLPRSAAAL